MDAAAWQRKVARRWRLVGLVSFCLYVGLHITGFSLEVVPGALAVIALARMSDGFGWADGWDARSDLDAVVEDRKP